MMNLHYRMTTILSFFHIVQHNWRNDGNKHKKLLSDIAV